MTIVPLFFELSDATTALPLLLLTHAAIFAGVGAAGGAGLAWEWGDRKAIVKCVLGGVVGALVATLAVEVINVAAFGIVRLRASAGKEHASVSGAPLRGPRHGDRCRTGW